MKLQVTHTTNLFLSYLIIPKLQVFTAWAKACAQEKSKISNNSEKHKIKIKYYFHKNDTIYKITKMTIKALSADYSDLDIQYNNKQ